MKKVLLGLVALIVVIVAALAIALMTFDADKYRPQLVDMLHQKTGRTVTLKGPIKLGLSLHGATLTIQDAAIGNPTWASRPVMAGIGKFELGISLLPLISHQVVITELQIVNADIQLETSGDKHNWDLAAAPSTPDKVIAEKPTATASQGKAISISADHVSITDSQIAIRDTNGKMSVFKTKILTYGLSDGYLAVHFEGSANATPVTLQLKTETKDFLANTAWNFSAGITYGTYDMTAKGKMNMAAKSATIDEYMIGSGSSILSGQLVADWSGPRPAVKGTLTSKAFNPEDFKPAAEASDEAPAAAAPRATSSNRVFSDEPLPFDSLKSADAAIDVAIEVLNAGNAKLQNVNGKIVLSNGRFSAPVKAVLGKDEIATTINIDAGSKPPSLQFGFTAPSLDLAELLHIANAPAFLTGSANVDIALSTSGYSMHNLAGNANGKINMIAAAGEVSSSAASGISSALMQIFAPKGNVALNCLAARFNIASGVLQDNGILVDSGATTVAGKGGANLGLETLNLTLHAKPKVGGIGDTIGGVLPPLQVSGTFKQPSFAIDSVAVAQNVVGMLTSGSIPGITSAGSVPTVETAPAGQNACVYTLDHPAAKSAETNAPLLPGVSGQIQKLKENGGSLLKGLLGQ